MARSTSPFPMSNIPLIDDYVKLLLHFNGTGNSFVDSSNINPKTITPIGTITQTTDQSKFNGKSCFVSTGGGVNGLATNSSADFDLGSGDFTIESWIYPLIAGIGHSIFSNRTSNGAAGIGYDLTLSASGLYTDIYASDNTAIRIGYYSTAKFNLNAWNHLALIRIGTSIKTAINGVLETVATTSKAIQNPAGFLRIGNEFHATGGFPGYLDEFRFSKGIARWTADFTPPTAPY